MKDYMDILVVRAWIEGIELWDNSVSFGQRRSDTWSPFS